MVKFPLRYLPKGLSEKDKSKQLRMLLKSKKLYKKNRYFTRKAVASFESKKSNHVIDAERIYKVSNVRPSRELAKATGCSLDALHKIVNKGEGAYFSSGSRPNQTAQSWGLARLASSITGGKAAAVDFDILDSGCNHNKTAYILAKGSRKKYKHGQSKTRKIIV
jgi:hypothetical protein